MDAQITAVYSGFTHQPTCQPPPCHTPCQNYPQQVSSSSTCNVQVPTSLKLVGTTSQGPASCGSGSAGWSRWVKWQVLDQQGQPINSQMNVSDKIAISGTNTCGASPKTGMTTTDGSGVFPDHYYLCSTGCVGQTCETDASQTYTVAGITLTRDVKSIIYRCTGITINGQ
jgi:hypothetical protein